MTVGTKACLVDVWQTILYGDFQARLRAITDYLGVEPDAWLRSWLGTNAERDRGNMSMAESYAHSLQACGLEPRPELIAELMRQDLEAQGDNVHLYDDTVPFFAGLRAQGIQIALVSNCGETTRPALNRLGVLPLVDAAILSCEVRSAKPSPEIYLIALKELGVAPADAVFIDDQPSFCAGSEAVGVRAIQIIRPALSDRIPTASYPVVSSLSEVAPLL